MDNTEAKKKVICIDDSIDGLTKDKVYEVEYTHDVYYGQSEYYGITDDNGKYHRCRANNFINTKQVVVSGSENCSGLLNPYWMVEYFKRQGKELFIFEEVEDEEYVFYKLQELSSSYNNFTKSYYGLYYSYNKSEDGVQFITKYDLSEEISREDEILIQIAKEINNEEYLKIINIPFDVEYIIRDCECSCGDYISEKHRTWY